MKTPKTQLALNVIFTSFKEGQVGKEQVKSAAIVIGFSDKGKPNLVVFLDGNPTATFAGEVLHKSEVPEDKPRMVYWEHCEPTAEILAVLEAKPEKEEEEKEEEKEEEVEEKE